MVPMGPREALGKITMIREKGQFAAVRVGIFFGSPKCFVPVVLVDYRGDCGSRFQGLPAGRYRPGPFAKYFQQVNFYPLLLNLAKIGCHCPIAPRY